MQVPESVHFYPKNRPKNSHSSSLEYYNTQLKIKFFHKKHLALSSILLFRDINVHSGTCIPQLKQKDRTYIWLNRLPEDPSLTEQTLPSHKKMNP